VACSSTEPPNTSWRRLRYGLRGAALIAITPSTCAPAPPISTVRAPVRGSTATRSQSSEVTVPRSAVVAAYDTRMRPSGMPNGPR
jgi:hypothetical protein